MGKENEKSNTTVEIAVREKEVLKKDLTALDANVNNYKIVDQTSRENGAVMLSAIKELKRKAEDKRKSLVDPLNSVVRAINAEFKMITEPLDKYEVTVKNEIARDYREQERIRMEKEREEQKRLDAERKKLEAQMKKAKDELSKELIQSRINEAEIVSEQKIEAVQEKKTVATSAGSTTVRKIWTWKYENPQAVDLSKIPLEYLKVDEGKITTAIRSGVREISGIVIYQTESIASR